MVVDSIAISDFEVFSKIDRDLNQRESTLNEFIKWTPDLSSFEEVIKQRNYPTDRAVLVSVLKEQYQFLATGQNSIETIEKLNDPHTFTVCTAHQPSLFGGPFFVVSKALSTIKLARQIQEKNPDSCIIPMFVMGSEDHDVDELNHTYINGQKILWNTEQKGPVGRFKLTDLESCIEELKLLLKGSAHEQKLISLIENAYKPTYNFAQAFQYLLVELLSNYGLLVINTDHPALKRKFSPFIKQELLEQTSRDWVTETQTHLAAKGYEPASYARNINVFYFDDGFRDRIEKDNGIYKIIGTEKEIPKNDFINEAEAHPERFSPNVILRPLYQEVLLPNLAYVGGGGELAYWLERKNQFTQAGVPYPMLVRRDSFLIINENDYSQFRHYRLQLSDLDMRSDVWINQLAERWSTSDLSLKPEEEELLKTMDLIKAKVIRIDPTLGATVEGEKTKLQKSIEYIEKKLLKAEKQKQEVQLNKAKKLRNRLMPDDALAERSESFMTYYAQYGDRLFEALLDDFNPLDYKFKMITI